MRRIKAITYCLLIAISCACCRSRKSEPIKVGIDTFVGFAPIYLARDKEKFKPYDLTVEPQIIMDTMERTTALASGRIDALCTTADSLLLAASNGVDLVVVAAVDESAGADGIVVKPGIKSVKDLSGRTVAFQEAMPSHFFLLSVLESARLKPSDILGIHMSADDAGAAFIAGKVDSAVTWEPWLSRAVQAGKGQLLVSTATNPNILIDVLAVRRDVLERRERDVLGLYLGWMNAIELWKQNREASERIMSSRLKLPLEEFHSNVATVRFADKKFNEAFFTTHSESSVWALGRRSVAIWKRAGVIQEASTFNPDLHITDKIVKLGEPAKLK